MLFLSVKDAEAALEGPWRWPHFSIAELACRCAGRFCAGEYYHDAEFLDGLEALRAAAGRALVINSGHRCDQWNAAVGGAALSWHKTIAVDVSLVAHDRHDLARMAAAYGFTGQGFARTFLHLDRRARPASWYYKGARDLWLT